MITIIVAYDETFGIGKDGGIPWRISEDMQHFKETIPTTENDLILQYN